MASATAVAGSDMARGVSPVTGEPERRFYGIASTVGIIGAVIMAPLFASHPHLPPNDPPGVLQTVLDFGPWLALHFALVVGILFLLAPLIAIARSVRAEAGEGYVLAGAAMTVALIASVFGILGQGVDGIGFHTIAELWQASPEEAKGSVVLVSAAVGVVGAGVFVLIMLMYFGFTSLVYAGACWGSEIYPRWLVIPQLLGGSLGVSAAVGTYFGSFSDFIYYYQFIPSAALFLIWIFIASLFLRRHVRAMGVVKI